MCQLDAVGFFLYNEFITKEKTMTEWINHFDNVADRQVRRAYFGWTHWANEMNGTFKKKKSKKKVRKNDRPNR